MHFTNKTLIVRGLRKSQNAKDIRDIKGLFLSFS